MAAAELLLVEPSFPFRLGYRADGGHATVKPQAERGNRPILAGTGKDDGRERVGGGRRLYLCRGDVQLAHAAARQGGRAVSELGTRQEGKRLVSWTFGAGSSRRSTIANPAGRSSRSPSEMRDRGEHEA